MTMSAERQDARTLLRSVGLRITNPRLAVLAALQEHPHSTADAVGAQARQTLGSVSTQAVYDVLRVCVDTGLVRKIEPAGSAALYETRAGDNHHHVICRSCGVVDDIDCAALTVPCLTPGQDHGFVVDEAEVVYWGHCAACQLPT